MRNYRLFVAVFAAVCGGFAAFGEEWMTDRSTPLDVGTTPYEITVASGKTVTMSGTITGSAAITKKGLGKLIITSANDGFTGGFTIEKGYLIASNATALGTAAVTILGRTAENTDDCILGLWGTGKGNTTGITYANAVNITGDSTFDYPSIIAYGQGAKLTGKLTAAKDFVFYDDDSSTKAISSKYSDRPDYVTSLTFGEVEVGGVLYHSGWCKFIFDGKVSAPYVSFANKRSSRFGYTSNFMSAYVFNAASEIGVISNAFHDITMGAENVFAGTEYIITDDVTSRATIKLGGKAQRVAYIDTPDVTSAGVLKTSNTRAFYNTSTMTTLTIDGGGSMPAGLSENRHSSMEAISGKLNLTIDAYDGFVQAFHGRTNTLSGTITVTSGALEIGPVSVFTALPTISIGANGRLSIDDPMPQAFDKVTSLTVDGRLEVSAATGNPFKDTVTLAIGANGVVDMNGGTLLAKSLTVNGAKRSGVLTHADLPNNIAEGTTIMAAGEPIEYIDTDMTASGDWSVYVFGDCSNVVRVAQTGAGKITKRGNGTLVLATENSYTGGTVIESGYVRVEADNVFGTGEVTLLGQTADYVGPCEIDMMGCQKVISQVTFYRTITNDIHITGNTTVTYPGIVGFYNASKVLGKITADQDFVFIDDQQSVKAVSGTMWDANTKVTSLTFGEIEVVGTLYNDGWTVFDFTGKVTADTLDVRRFRGAGNENAKYNFREDVSFGTVYNYARTMTFQKGLVLAGKYQATYPNDLAGGSLTFNGTSPSVGGLVDTSSIDPTAVKWTMTVGSGLTLSITGIDGEDSASTGYKFDGAGSIAVDAEGFVQEFRDRANALSGALMVKQGTLRMTGTSRFSMATGIVVSAGANFVNESTAANSLALARTLTIDGHLVSPAAAFDSATTALNRLALGENAQLDLQGGELRVTALFVNGQAKPAGSYDASVYPQITSGRVVALSDAPGFTPTPATWNGTAWDPSNVNLLDGTVAATFDSTVSSTTFDSLTRLYGITFAADVTGYSVGGSGLLTIGAGGITIADNSNAANTYTFATKMEMVRDQDWIIPPKGKLVFDDAITNQAGKITVHGGKTAKIACDLVFRGTNVIAGAMVVTGATVNVVSGLIGTPNHENQGKAVNGGDKTLSVLGYNNGVASIYMDKGAIEKPMYLTYSGDSMLKSANNTTNYFRGDLQWTSPWFGFRPGKNSELVFEGGFTTGHSMRSYGSDSTSVIRIREKPIVSMKSVGWNINSGTLALDVEGNKFNYLTTSQYSTGSGNIDFGVSYAITNSNNNAFLPGFYWVDGTGKGMTRDSIGDQNVYFHSTTQTVSTLAGCRVCTFHADEGARLEVFKQTTPEAAKLPNDRIYFSSQIEGPLTLVMRGDGALPLILSNQTFHSTGSLVVTKGTMEVAADAEWKGAPTVEIGGTGKLKVGKAGSLGRKSALTIAGTGELYIQDDGEQIFSEAIVNGVQLLKGTYTPSSPETSGFLKQGSIRISPKGTTLMLF